MTAYIIKAPEEIHPKMFSIFLGGSIEMGKAVDWQTEITNKLCHYGMKGDFQILNPRRDDWDSSWEQSIDNPKFNEQVSWELNAQELSDILIYNFEPGTKSPITLLELGLFAPDFIRQLYVRCPKDFWRKGNVDIVCQRYKVPVYENWDDLEYDLGHKINAVLEAAKDIRVV